MAEKLVSAGVFTRENDLSFLQQGVAEIGAAFVGPFKQGPAVPTIVNSQTEFETLFGTVDDTYYTPLAVQNYLREAGTATICRVVGKDGYTETKPLMLIASTGSYSASLGILFSTSGSANAGFSDVTASALGNGDIVLSGSTFGMYTTSFDLEDTNDIEAVFGSSVYGSKKGYAYAFFKENGFLYNTGSYTLSGPDGILTGSFTGSFGANISASVIVLDNQSFGAADVSANEALTPMVQSQLISGDRHPLFKFETIGVGNAANTQVK
ncbi:MAG: hypothetical protein RLZZ196_2488, partial [Bacteroidota bacterium]